MNELVKYGKLSMWWQSPRHGGKAELTWSLLLIPIPQTLLLRNGVSSSARVREFGEHVVDSHSLCEFEINLIGMTEE